MIYLKSDPCYGVFLQPKNHFVIQKAKVFRAKTRVVTLQTLVFAKMFLCKRRH
jgi:hypothetical protein